MDAMERLRFAYLSGAADAGKTSEQVQAQLIKQANETFDPVGATGKAISGLASYGIPAYGAAMGASLLGGGMVGYGARSLGSLPALTPEEVKAQELAQTYRMFADRVKRRRRLTDVRLGNMDKLKEKEEEENFLPLF